MWCIVPMAFWIGVLAFDLLRQYESSRSIGYHRHDLTWPGAERVYAIAAFLGIAIGSAMLGRLVPARSGLASACRHVVPLVWLLVAGMRIHTFVQEWWFVVHAPDGSRRGTLFVTIVVAVLTAGGIAAYRITARRDSARAHPSFGMTCVRGAVVGGSVVLGYLAADSWAYAAHLGGILIGSFLLTVVLDAGSRAFGRPRATAWLTLIRVAHYLQWFGGVIIALVGYVTASSSFGASITVLNVSATIWYPAFAVLVLAATLAVLVVMRHRTMTARARAFQLTTPSDRSRDHHAIAHPASRMTVVDISAISLLVLIFGANQMASLITIFDPLDASSVVVVRALMQTMSEVQDPLMMAATLVLAAPIIRSAAPSRAALAIVCWCTVMTGIQIFVEPPVSSRETPPVDALTMAFGVGMIVAGIGLTAWAMPRRTCLDPGTTAVRIAALAVAAVLAIEVWMILPGTRVVTTAVRIMMWLGVLWVLRWHVACAAGPIAWRVLTGTLLAHRILFGITGVASIILVAMKLPDTRYWWWSDPSDGVGYHLRWLVVRCAQDLAGATSGCLFLPGLIATITALVIAIRARRTMAHA